MRLVEGAATNIKITVPADLALAEAILGGIEMRHTDRHRLRRTPPDGGAAAGFRRRGASVCRWALTGHSDADVLTHAVMDALLGAAALGDIGTLFPDTDDRCLGCDSIRLLLLGGGAGIVRSRGYRISNIDSTIVAQRPKLAAHLPDMARRTWPRPWSSRRTASASRLPRRSGWALRAGGKGFPHMPCV